MIPWELSKGYLVSPYQVLRPFIQRDGHNMNIGMQSSSLSQSQEYTMGQFVPSRKTCYPISIWTRCFHSFSTSAPNNFLIFDTMRNNWYIIWNQIKGFCASLNNQPHTVLDYPRRKWSAYLNAFAASVTLDKDRMSPKPFMRRRKIAAHAKRFSLFIYPKSTDFPIRFLPVLIGLLQKRLLISNFIRCLAKIL